MKQQSRAESDQLQAWTQAGGALTLAKERLVDGLTAIAPYSGDERSRVILQHLADMTTQIDTLIGWMGDHAAPPVKPPALPAE